MRSSFASNTALITLLVLLMGTIGLAQQNPTRVAVLDFSILAENGTVLPRSQSKSSDLARLSSLLPRAMAALLQRTGRYEVTLDFAQLEDQSLLEITTALLQDGQVDEVIIGTFASVGKSVAISAERYVIQEGSVRRQSNTVLNAATVDEVLGFSQRILAELYPGDSTWVQQQLSLLVLEPSALRLPVGRSAQLKPLALDASGKPILNGRTLFASSNPAVAMVDENGNITALSPGQATISAQVVGVPRQGNLNASTPVTVVPPYFGLRVGVGALPRAGEFALKFRAGFSLTPTTTLTAPNITKTATTITSDPLTLMLNFFQSLLSSGPFTFALELSQDQLDVGLLTTQWNDIRYLSIGLIYSQALNSTISTGLGIRLSTGVQIPTGGNMAIPLEFVTDVLFNNPGPTVRFGIQTGINLFQ